MPKYDIFYRVMLHGLAATNMASITDSLPIVSTWDKTSISLPTKYNKQLKQIVSTIATKLNVSVWSIKEHLFSAGLDVFMKTNGVKPKGYLDLSDIDKGSKNTTTKPDTKVILNVSVDADVKKWLDGVSVATGINKSELARMLFNYGIPFLKKDLDGLMRANKQRTEEHMRMLSKE